MSMGSVVRNTDPEAHIAPFGVSWNPYGPRSESSQIMKPWGEGSRSLFTLTPSERYLGTSPFDTKSDHRPQSKLPARPSCSLLLTTTSRNTTTPATPTTMYYCY